MIKFYKHCSDFYDCLNLRVELEYLYPSISMGSDLVYYKPKDVSFGEPQDREFQFGGQYKRTNQVVLRRSGNYNFDDFEIQAKRFRNFGKTLILNQNEIVGFLAFATDKDIINYRKEIDKSFDSMTRSAHAFLDSFKIKTPERIKNFQEKIKEINQLESVWKFLYDRAKSYKRINGVEKNVKVNSNNELVEENIDGEEKEK